MAPQPDMEEIPRPATGWAVVVLIFLAAAFAWAAIEIIQIEEWPLSAVVLFTTCWLGLGVIAMSGIILHIFTRLDYEGVTQLSVLGFKRLLWKDVISFSQGQKGDLKISNDETTIIISPMLYSSAGVVTCWVRNRLEEESAPVMSKES